MSAKNFLKNLQDLKEELTGLIKEGNYKEIQEEVKTIVKGAKSDIGKFIDDEILPLKKKLEEDKDDIEKMVRDRVAKEMVKARDFMEKQQDEISIIQKKVEKMIPKEAKDLIKKTSKKIKKKIEKKLKKKTTKKKTTKKKVAKKKMAKTAKKKITKKKVTKKTTRKR